jgi:hypothetical protein
MLASPFYASAPGPAHPTKRISRALRRLRVRAASLFRPTPRYRPLVANRPIPTPYYHATAPAKPYLAGRAVSGASSARPFLAASRNATASSYAPSVYGAAPDAPPVPALPPQFAAASAESVRSPVKRKRVPYDVLENGVVVLRSKKSDRRSRTFDMLTA